MSKLEGHVALYRQRCHQQSITALISLNRIAKTIIMSIGFSLRP